jgi:hypothetical protein
MQAYQGGIDQALQQIVAGQKMQELQRKREQEARARQAQEQLASMTQPVTPLSSLSMPGRAGPTADRAGMVGQTPELTREQALRLAMNPDLPSPDREALFKYAEALKPTEAKLPTSAQEYQLAQSDPRFAEFLRQRQPPGPTNVFNLATAQQQMFKEVDIPIVQSYTSAATSSGEFARTSETINRLLKGKGGGEIVKVGTDLAKTLGLESNQVAAQDLANSLVVQLAPKMRAPGSGSTSDIEFKSYLSATPSLSNSEKGRDIMSKYANAFAERNAKLADYARKLASENKLTFEAMREYDNKLGPVLGKDFYELTQDTGGMPSSSGGVIDFRTSVRGGR